MANEVDPYADIGGRTLSELEHDIMERWARPDRDTMLALLARLREAEATAAALGDARNDLVRRAESAEARVAELASIVSDYEKLHDPLIAIADAAEVLRDATRARLTVWTRETYGAVEDALSQVDAALAARGSR